MNVAPAILGQGSKNANAAIEPIADNICSKRASFSFIMRGEFIIVKALQYFSKFFWLWLSLLVFATAISLSTPAVLAHGDEDHTSSTASPATTVQVESAGAEDTTAGQVEVNEHNTLETKQCLSGEACDADHHDKSVSHAHDGQDHHGIKTESKDAHDHSAHGPNALLLESSVGRLLVWLGKFHPAAVHFPIALLLSAAFAELLSLRSKHGFFPNAVRFCLWIGALGAVGAALLGWLYGGFRITDEESILTFHRWNGTTIAVLALLALWLEEQRVRTEFARNGAIRSVLFAVALLVGLNGYLGGLMVYGPEQHEWPKSEVVQSH